MTNAKNKVKDLSTDLGVSNKDMLHAMRELGIPAKSHMSSLTDEEATAIRSFFQSQAKPAGVVRKEINPGVIVRRRVKSPPAEELVAAPIEAPVAAPEPRVQALAEEPETPSVVAAPQATETPHAGARIVKPAREPLAEENEAPAAHDIEERPAPQTSEEPVELHVQAPDADHVEAKPEPAPTTAAADGETQAPKPAASEDADSAAGRPSVASPTGPTTETDEDGLDEQGRRKKKRKKKREVIPEPPQVKIISRPEVVVIERPTVISRPPARPESRPGAGPSSGPGGPGAGAPGGYRPRPAGGPGRGPSSGPGGPGGPGRGPAPATPAAAKPGDDASRKRHTKDRRVVEFTPTVSEEEDRRRASLQVKKKKGVVIQDKTGGKIKTGKRRSREEFIAQQQQQHVTQPLKATKRKLKVEEAIRVSDMAHQMGVKAQALIKVLFGMGVMATINQSLDMDTATLVAAEFGYEVEKVGFSEDDYLIPQIADAPEDLKPRPPVVTIMGHVDHGKTSLLDAIRKTNVTSGEAGGITQHIGAYHVKTKRGEIVFLDTPGHEAFTAMRARGAQVTDIVVLVVAADDGVMDQTREAINHARAAKVPIVVAVNKIDKDGADPDRVKRELSELGLLSEDWGGDTIFAHVSAKKRIGLDELLELILLQAEVLDLKANPEKPARGRVVEAKLDKGRGAVATVLVQEGVLRQGDTFVCGLYNGRVRAMFNDQGKKIREAGPSIPVEIQGFDGVPEAGDEFACMLDEKIARRIAEQRQVKSREKLLAKESKVTLETFLKMRGDKTETQMLNLVLKSDVQGSFEAVTEALQKLSTEEVKVQMIHGGTGAITESDIMLASASNAIIIGFNVRPTVKVKEVAERESVEIRFYDIIYKLVEEIKDAMSGMLSPLVREIYLGQAEVRNTFSVPKVGTVAGCGVVDGKITRNAGVRLLRDGVVIYTGKAASLRRFKDDVKEVLKGYECGIGLENYNDIKVGDFIEAFDTVSEARTLE
jgi:translation initiation factor IF-2